MPDVTQAVPSAMYALERWRIAEAEYARLTEPLLRGEADWQELDRDAMIEMASLRNTADRWRESYFLNVFG